MRFREVISRMTGISCPIFGVSSDPPQPEVDAAKRVLRGLEDRRVLYNPFQLEDPHHCVQSVLEVRRLLTGALGEPHVSEPLADNLRAMRAACRKFLNRTQPEDGEPSRSPLHGAWGQNDFFDALGELRGVFGVHVAQVAARYGLDVEDELASILPEVDDDGDGRRKSKPTKRKGRIR